MAAWEFFASGDSVGRVRGRLPGTTTARRPTLPATTTVPPVHGVYAGWVEHENAQPGTADWNIANLGDPHSIEGFFDTMVAYEMFVVERGHFGGHGPLHCAPRKAR